MESGWDFSVDCLIVEFLFVRFCVAVCKSGVSDSYIKELLCQRNKNVFLSKGLMPFSTFSIFKELYYFKWLSNWLASFWDTPFTNALEKGENRVCLQNSQKLYIALP